MLQLYSAVVPIPAIVALHVLPPALFALIHGSCTYGPKCAAIFAVVCLGTDSFFENLSLRTGFPFGHYYFTGVMGPKVFQLPILLALAYLGLGYVSWSLAVLILGRAKQHSSGARVFLVPAIAAFIITAWDLAMEPVWSTLDRAWIWVNGGPYFGVPVSHFFGWYFTTYAFYQLFALHNSQSQTAACVAGSLAPARSLLRRLRFWKRSARDSKQRRSSLSGSRDRRLRASLVGLRHTRGVRVGFFICDASICRYGLAESATLKSFLIAPANPFVQLHWKYRPL